MKRLALALSLACYASTAGATEPATIRRLVEHYTPYYFKYLGPQEATGAMSMMNSQQFIHWLQEAGADDDAVRRTLALRNARLEVASAFDFIFGPLDRHTQVEDMANLLIQISEASKSFQRHTGEPPQHLTDLWQDPALPHWSGPYLKPDSVKPFFKRFQQLEITITLASDAIGTPPPPCPDPQCISWSWLEARGLPPLYAHNLDLWLDTETTPAQGQVRLTPQGFIFTLMRTNK